MARQAEFISANQDVTEIVFDTQPQGEKTDAENKTDSIAAALSEDSEAFLNVSRQTHGGNSPMEFVGRFPADKFDYGQLQFHLQQNYGSGDYRIMLYAKGKVKANKLLTVASKIAVENNTQGTDQLSLVLREFQKMQTQMMEIMRAQNGSNNSRREMLEEMMMYKQLFGGESRSSNGIKDIVETITGLKELGLNIGGNNEDENGFGSLLEKATPLIQAAIQSQPQQPVYRPNPIQPKAPDNMSIIIRTGVNTLIRAAAKQSDAGNYAAMITDNFTPDQIKNFFGRPNSFEFLQSINPEVVNFKPWFEDLAEHVKALMGWPSIHTDLYTDGESDNFTEDDLNGEIKDNEHN